MKQSIKTTIIAAVALLAVACGGNHSQTQNASEKYPYGDVEIQALPGGACGAPSYIAYEKGFFEREGLNVTLVSGDFETQKIGLASGKFAVANGDFQFFPSAHQGLDIKIIAGLHQGCIQILVPPGSPIKTVEQLAGKRIGVDEIGSSAMAVASILVANHGIDPKEGVTWLPFPRDQLPTVAEKGLIDAVALWDPFGPIAVQRGYTSLCDISTDPLFAGKYCCFLFASGKQLRENPERIKAILRAYHKASEWIAANPEETARIVTEKGYVPTGDTVFVAELIRGYKYHAKHDASTKQQAKGDATYFVDELKKAAFLPKDLDTHKFVDNLYVDVLGDEELGSAHNAADTTVQKMH
ncbi:MAG: ABC transporter substrate-binding protein [Prevotellaceae bacterium]|jgi:NitT/TauT family transport system substrate-binding protein|nr:ABC transporter substrate-binding protein [Prevotellaceae bacterium]